MSDKENCNFCSKELHKQDLVFFVFSRYWTIDKIQFCPFCGKKLKEDKNE